MVFGISSLLFNFDDALSLCEKIPLIKHIELGIDNLDECKVLYKYKEKINKLNISLSIHLPMELNSCENINYINDSWVKFISTMNKELTDFDIKYYNFHLGYAISSRLKNNRNKYLDNSIKFIRNILKNDINISIENVYSSEGDFSNIGNKSYDFEYIFNRIKSDKLCFCYDTGHYLINRDDYLNRLIDKIEVIHLSDNYGVEDIHIGIGRGILTKEHISKVVNLNPKYLILEINFNHIEDTINKLNDIIKEV